MEILETKGRKMNKIKREERENLHTFSDTTTEMRVWRFEYTYFKMWTSVCDETNTRI